MALIVDIQPAINLRKGLRRCRLFALTCFLTVPVLTYRPWSAVAWGLVLLEVAVGLFNAFARSNSRRAAGFELALTATLAPIAVGLSARVLVDLFRGSKAPWEPACALFVTGLLYYRLWRFANPQTPDSDELHSVTTLLGVHYRQASQLAVAGSLRIFVELCVALVLIFAILNSQESLVAYLLGMLLSAEVVMCARTWQVGLALRSSDPTETLRATSIASRSSAYSWYLLRHGEYNGRVMQSLGATVAWTFAGPIVLTLVSGWVFSIPFSLYAITSAYRSYRSVLRALADGVTDEAAVAITNRSDFSLYLRSFADDPVELDFGAKGWRRLLWIGLTGGMFASVLRSVRLEEFICKAMWPLRPVVAICPPGGAIDSIGAPQLHFDEMQWREAVTTLAKRCKSILMVAADTSGFSWEFEMINREGLRNKVVLLLPEEAPEETWRRWVACFGESTSVAKEMVVKTIALRLRPDGLQTLVTSVSRTPFAYRLAIRLAEGLEPRATS
jgi:hypothetical protein